MDSEKKYMQSQYSFITLNINNTGKNKIYYDGDDYNSGCSPGAPLPAGPCGLTGLLFVFSLFI